MNSIHSGDCFESTIFNFFESEIAADRFYAKSECCKIFRRKGYYSKDRRKNIKFDISIEIYLPGSKFYSILILIECKNYNHAVPVDDAEEFFAKVQQISGANVKGIIASTNAFQEGTLNYCSSKGMGALRYFGNSDFKWVLHRSPSTIHSWTQIKYNRMELHRGLTTKDYLSRHFDFYCCYNDQYTYSLKTFLLAISNSQDRSLLSHVKNRLVTQPTVHFVSREQIENLAQSVLKQVEYDNGAIPLDKICEWQASDTGLSTRIGIQPSRGDLKAGALGRIRFDPLEITIYDLPDMTQTRQRFTLAHELGHLFLGHSRYMSGEYCDIADLKLDSDSPFKPDDLRRMDWQANYFAACLLLPRTTITRDVLALAEERDVRNRGFGLLYVDEQNCNKAVYNGITSHLKLRYKVSALALRLRLEELDLLRDVRPKNASFTGLHRTSFQTADDSQINL